jgi:hypothetical protein
MDSKQKSDWIDVYAKLIEETIVQDHHVKLCMTSPVDDFDFQIYGIVASCYKSVDPVVNRIGSIYNAIFTQRTSVFLLTRNLMDELVSGDVNQDLKSCSTDHYNSLKARLHHSGIIETLRPSKHGVAGLYELKHPMYLGPLEAKVGKEILLLQKEKKLIWYDETNRAKSDKPEKILIDESVMTEEELEVKRRLDEKRKNRS